MSAQLDAQLLGDAELQPLPGLQVFQTLQSACCSGILSYATYFDAQLPGGARLLLLLDLQGHLAVLLFRKSHRLAVLLVAATPCFSSRNNSAFVDKLCTSMCGGWVRAGPGGGGQVERRCGVAGGARCLG